MVCSACFCGVGGSLALRPARAPSPRRARRAAHRPRLARAPRCSVLSAPFPVPDAFAVVVPQFSSGRSALDLRPELLGSLLWACALYLGVWGERWGSRLRGALARMLSSAAPLSAGAAETCAEAVHTLPFLLAGFGVDAVLRASSGGNAVGAVASGLSLALYAGVGELGRISAGARAPTAAEGAQFGQFCDFARHALRRSGRCHLVDVRAALRRDGRYARIARASDGELRALIRRFAPDARRSPNGFYRGLSVRDADDARRRGDG